MKRFKFSLQTVHDYREFRRDAAEREFADAIAQLHGAKALLEEVRRARRLALDNYLLMYQSREIEARMIGAHTDFITSLSHRERAVLAQIAVIEKRIESKRQAVTAALRATKTTGQLRDQQRRNHELDASRTEQNQLDEMAVAAIARRRLHQ